MRSRTRFAWEVGPFEALLLRNLKSTLSEREIYFLKRACVCVGLSLKLCKVGNLIKLSLNSYLVTSTITRLFPRIMYKGIPLKLALTICKVYFKDTLYSIDFGISWPDNTSQLSFKFICFVVKLMLFLQMI